jgi:uncharacterized Zn finger protein
MEFYGWRPYVSAAERRRNAASEMAKLKKKGHPVSPVVVEGRTIVKTFWGKAWCENLERYSDYENRLPRGRTYVRNGSVIDLQIAPGEIKAVVSGSEIYKVKVKVAPVAQARWESICKDCAGAIESLIELLQGRLSKGVMERVCRQKTGLFPSPDEIQLSCSCPDWADMCKHVAAVLYGIGARLDQQPDLIFRLHNVDEKELIAGTGTALPQAKRAPAANKVLGGEDLSALFGLDIAQGTGIDGGLGGAETGEPKRGEPIAERRTGKQVRSQAKACATILPNPTARNVETPGTGKRVPAASGRKDKVRAQGSAGKRRKQATAALESRGLKKK